MGRIAKSSIQEVFNKLDAVAVVEDYVRLEKRGGRYWGRCPFHSGGSERTPSFTVDPDRKLFYCFGCQKGGSIIDFIMEMDNVAFADAIKNLARKFSVELAYDGDGEGDNRDALADQSRKNELYELYSRAAVTFQHFLTERPEGKPAFDYLSSRQVSQEMIRRFQLGFSPGERNWLYGFLQNKGYSTTFLDESGLFSQNYKGMSFFSGRLMFPIKDRHGQVVAFGGRAMPGAKQNDGKEPPKYLNTRETDAYKKSQILYALDMALPEIRKTKTVYLAEGYMDVIALHQAGVTNAVASCGTAFTDEQAKLLRHWADKAVLVFDADEAGQQAAMKGILICRKNGLLCYLVAQSGDSDEAILKDPAEILQKFGEDTLKNAMNCVILDFDYLIAKGRSLYDVATPKGKAEAFALLYPYFDALDSRTERDACIDVASDELRSDKAAIVSDYERWKRSNGSDSPRGGTEKPQSKEVSDTERPIQMNDELFLLIVVSVNIFLYPEFRASIEVREIEDPYAKELFVVLEECYTHEENRSDLVLSRISSSKLRNFVIERGMSPEFRSDSKRDPRKLMEDGIRRIKGKRLRRRRSELGAELRLLERSSDIGAEADIQGLIAEKMHIDAELRKLEGN